MKQAEEKANSSWGGRFTSGPAQKVAEFTDSQHYDRILYAHDIEASCAHAAMLAKQGIIAEAEARAIIDGLNQVKAEIENGEFVWKQELEDVHMNIESRLTELIGEPGKKLHTGRSRNDQVGLTFRLYVAACLEQWSALCVKLCQVLCQIAGSHAQTLMPGFTHFQPAQPVSLAQHLLAYAGMFRRDMERITATLERTRISPLGAAALAGSTYPLDPAYVAEAVGFPKLYANSMDAVSDRDFVLEALFDASLIIMHLSRLCEEIIIWANPAFGFVRLPDAYATGSSIMPQKKNPDVAELIRGKTGRVFGALMGLLTTLKGLPLAYNRDLQEDKEGFLDTDKTIQAALELMAAMLAELQFVPAKMAAACQQGYLNATELADYLVGRGVPFREAHHITGHAVALAEKLQKPLEDLTLAELQGIDQRIGPDVHGALACTACVNRRETPGGTGPKSVAKQLKDFQTWFASLKAGGNA